MSEKKVLKVIYPSTRKVESGRMGKSFIICTPLIIKAVLHTSLRYRTGVEVEVYSFLTTTVDGGDWADSGAERFTLWESALGLQ